MWRQRTFWKKTEYEKRSIRRRENRKFRFSRWNNDSELEKLQCECYQIRVEIADESGRYFRFVIICHYKHCSEKCSFRNYKLPGEIFQENWSYLIIHLTFSSFRRYSDKVDWATKLLWSGQKLNSTLLVELISNYRCTE